MAGVLGLDAVMPGEECDFEAGQPGCLDVQEAVFQLLPEAGRRPVLDGEARPFGDLVVFVAEEALSARRRTEASRSCPASACPGYESPVRVPRPRLAATRNAPRLKRKMPPSTVPSVLTNSGSPSRSLASSSIAAAGAAEEAPHRSVRR